MLHPRTHSFLLWAGPTLVIFFGASVGLIAALAQPYSGVKEWGQNQFDRWWPLVTTPWFIFLSIVLILGYLAALIHTGRAAPSPQIPSEPPSKDAIEARLIWEALRARDRLDQVSALPQTVAAPDRIPKRDLARAKANSNAGMHQLRDALYEGQRPTHVLGQLQKLGIDLVEVQKEIERRRAIITNDAAYLLDDPTDVYFWPDRYAKREWHLFDVEAQCVSSFMYHTKTDLERQWRELEKQIAALKES